MSIQGKKQVDLAEYMNLTRQTTYKIMTGTRLNTAVELKLIADYLGISMDALMDSSGRDAGEDPLLAFRHQVSGTEALQGIATPEELV